MRICINPAMSSTVHVDAKRYCLCQLALCLLPAPVCQPMSSLLTLRMQILCFSAKRCEKDAIDQNQAQTTIWTPCCCSKQPWNQPNRKTHKITWCLASASQGVWATGLEQPSDPAIPFTQIVTGQVLPPTASQALESSFALRPLAPGPASAKALMARQMHLPCAIRAFPNHSARWRTGFHLEGGRYHRRRSVSPKAAGLTEGRRSHRSPWPRWLRHGSRHSPARNWGGHPPFEGYPNINFKLRIFL